MQEHTQAESARLIEGLLDFAAERGMIEPLDRIPARNALLDLLGVAEPCEADSSADAGPDGRPEATAALPAERAGRSAADGGPVEGPVAILDRLLDDAAARGIIPDNTTTQRDLLDARIMGLLMPRQSEVARRFRELAEREGIRAATDWFYGLSGASNYIRWDRIRRNEYWRTETPYGSLEITVNLSKPEKDPKEIAAERNAPQSAYPKCLLCLENVGYAGRVNHPARQNHRVLPVTLDGQPWYFQYSPYLYYNEHCILFDQRHIPMKITERTFVKLLDFVGRFPHYFAGSNADLPIVGGSILSHDHFQGGRHSFPMAEAPVERSFRHPDYPQTRIGIVRWPMSVIRVSGPDRGELERLAAAFLNDWRGYSDPSVGILAGSEEAGGRVPHNTITPIARINADGEPELDLVLRNNRRSEEHPDGIYHPHRELHHIKKENIGLIEVMGLAVLPGRLKQELAEVRDMLSSGRPYRRDDLAEPMAKHADWIDRLTAEHGTSLSGARAEALLRDEVGRIFLEVLMHAGVYKRDSRGQAAFAAYLARFGAAEV